MSGIAGGYEDEIDDKLDITNNLLTSIKDNQATEEKQDDIVTAIGNIPATDVSDLATSANQTTTNTALAKLIGFEIPAYDYISLSYTSENLTGVVYKTGGSGGTTVATLTLAYTGSVLDTITKT